MQKCLLKVSLPWQYISTIHLVYDLSIFPLVNDTLESVFDESGDEEEQDAIVSQVLDEIGIEISGKVANLKAIFSHKLCIVNTIIINIIIITTTTTITTIIITNIIIITITIIIIIITIIITNIIITIITIIIIIITIIIIKCIKGLYMGHI